MGLFGKKESIGSFDPNKVKKLSDAEIIERLKKEEQEDLQNETTGVFVNFDEVEG